MKEKGPREDITERGRNARKRGKPLAPRPGQGNEEAEKKGKESRKIIHNMSLG